MTVIIHFADGHIERRDDVKRIKDIWEYRVKLNYQEHAKRIPEVFHRRDFIRMEVMVCV